MEKQRNIKVPDKAYQEAVKVRALYTKWSDGMKITFGQLLRMGVGALAKHMKAKK
jgi:hypothetical protein